MELKESIANELSPEVSVVHGRDLTPEELRVINESRTREFGSSSPISIEQGDENYDKLYFLVRNGSELVAFGRLHNVEAELNGKRFHVLGIATIVAVQKGRGYGTALMQKMKDHIESEGKTAIGFCNPAVSDFYSKCGYSIVAGGVRRVTYVEDNTAVTVPDSRADGDILYLEGSDGLMKKLITDPDAKLTVFRAPW